MNYNYIYWSLLYDKTEELIIKDNSKVGLQNQIVNFQYSTIDGFISNGKQLKVLNCLCVGNYPFKYKSTFYWKLVLADFENQNNSALNPK